MPKMHQVFQTLPPKQSKAGTQLKQRPQHLTPRLIPLGFHKHQGGDCGERRCIYRHPHRPPAQTAFQHGNPLRNKSGGPPAEPLGRPGRGSPGQSLFPQSLPVTASGTRSWGEGQLVGAGNSSCANLKLILALQVTCVESPGWRRKDVSPGQGSLCCVTERPKRAD